jgi:flagellar M-ring protein FliF
MKALVEGLRALGAARLAAMGAVALGMLGMLALMVMRGGTEQMALLYGDLDLRDSGQVAEQLTRRHIPYRIAANGSQILVPADQVPEARVALAKEGLPSGGSIGYEIFDRGDSLAATEFQQKINETRAMEGEIARTIRAMQGIRAVRVHLVLPRREPFAREQQDAQASVMLTMSGAARLDREGIQAILNLVSAAVPGLRPQNIAIVDSRGDLLARAGTPVGAAAAALSAEEVRRATELRLSRAVEEMLERSLGAGHVRAEAAVRMSFDKFNQTEERYDPDGQVTRSTQTVDSKSKNTEAQQTVSVQNNLPNANAGQQPGAGSQDSRQEETTNYEISKTIRTLIKDQPQIDRIDLAVMVDGTDVAAADGKHTWQPRSAEELNRITGLVRTAIGYDEKRGDHVEVVSMQFVSDSAGAVTEDHGVLGMKLEKADMLHLAQTALFGVIGVVALLLVLRPMVLRITSVAPGALAGPGGSLAAISGAATSALSGPVAQAALAAAGTTQMLEDESMVKIAQIEGQMRASSLRRISELAEKHPDETLAIVRGWMVQENS